MRVQKISEIVHKVVLQSSRIVLCFCLFLALFSPSSTQHSRWRCSTARCCGGQGLPVISVGAPDGPLPTGTHRAPQINPESTSGYVKNDGKPLRRRTVQLSTCGWELDDPKGGSSSSSALARILDPPKSDSSSYAAIQLLPLSGDTAADAERGQLPQPRKGRMGSSGL